MPCSQLAGCRCSFDLGDPVNRDGCGVEPVEIMVAGQEDSASRFRRRCDPEVVVLRIVSAPQVEDRKVRIGIDDLGKPRVDPDDFSEQAREVSHGVAPQFRWRANPRISPSAMVEIRGRSARAVRANWSSIQTPVASCLARWTSTFVSSKTRVWLRWITRSAPARQQSLHRSRLRASGPRLRRHPTSVPGGYGARKDRSAVSSAMGCGTRERIRPPPL